MASRHAHLSDKAGVSPCVNPKLFTWRVASRHAHLFDFAGVSPCVRDLAKTLLHEPTDRLGIPLSSPYGETPRASLVFLMLPVSRHAHLFDLATIPPRVRGLRKKSLPHETTDRPVFTLYLPYGETPRASLVFLMLPVSHRALEV